MPAKLEAPFTSATILFENDVLAQLGHNEDRNYTGGLGLVAGGGFVQKLHLDAPLQLFDRIAGINRKHEASDNHQHSFMFVGTGFTPDVLNTASVVKGDRPYASIIGLSVSQVSIEKARRRSTWTSDFTLGVLGLSAVGNVQKKIHAGLRRKSGEATPYEPLGWHNQISDGGEPTALYRVAYQQQIAGDGPGPNIRKHFQLVAGGEASAGYYTNVAATASARLGFFTTDFWQFTPNGTNVANQAYGQTATPRWEAFIFAGLRPRVVAYNALLQGQFRKSVYTVTPRRFLAEFDLGVGVYIPFAHMRLTWDAFAGRTAEFTTTRRTHTWGSYQLGFHFGDR